MSENNYRHEDKYVLDNLQTEILKARARAVLRPDAHVRADGYYGIKSLYFDDINNGCYFDAANGNDPRAKFRIRLYNNDLSMIRLEKKIKKNGLTLKEQTIISREECESLILGKTIDVGKLTDENKKKLIMELTAGGFLPVIIIEYERLPFIYPATDIRFTIDRRITYSTDVRSFWDTDKKAVLSLGGGFSIMELKWNHFLPGHLTEYLSINTLQRSRFSKYYYCRSNTI